RVSEATGSNMAGWYACRGLYDPEALGGLSCARFCEALSAEGVPDVRPGANFPLHLHPVFHELDFFRQGKPTAIAFGQRDVRQGPGSLPVSESLAERAFSVPWFKHDWPEEIERYAYAFRKVVANAEALLAADAKR